MRDLKKGEIVLRVPKSALMTRESVMEDEKLCFVVSRHSCLSSAQVSFLAVYVLLSVIVLLLVLFMLFL